MPFDARSRTSPYVQVAQSYLSSQGPTNAAPVPLPVQEPIDAAPGPPPFQGTIGAVPVPLPVQETIDAAPGPLPIQMPIAGLVPVQRIVENVADASDYDESLTEGDREAMSAITRGWKNRNLPVPDGIIVRWVHSAAFLGGLLHIIDAGGSARTVAQWKIREGLPETQRVRFNVRIDPRTKEHLQRLESNSV
ncbi:hypothetical protein EJ04DRAFT_589496 [Polyplosphaeria fusca]|uniref:Uncharacterized protein n=1 Tax=Polyplosphaeria fusca TaxID=682080 RepID=A0A9P4UXS9_9PLEO|nr:hypothetical protein EJ04DRAFT_589496 [Polyplosphaeria fusca]